MRKKLSRIYARSARKTRSTSVLPSSSFNLAYLYFFQLNQGTFSPVSRPCVHDTRDPVVNRWVLKISNFHEGNLRGRDPILGEFHPKFRCVRGVVRWFYRCVCKKLDQYSWTLYSWVSVGNFVLGFFRIWK